MSSYCKVGSIGNLAVASAVIARNVSIRMEIKIQDPVTRAALVEELKGRFSAESSKSSVMPGLPAKEVTANIEP